MAWALISLVNRLPFQSAKVISRFILFSRGGRRRDRFFSRHRLPLSYHCTHLSWSSSQEETNDRTGASTTSRDHVTRCRGKKKRELDGDHRRRISLVMLKMSHPLKNYSPYPYNITYGILSHWGRGDSCRINGHVRENDCTVPSIPSHRSPCNRLYVASSGPWNAYGKVWKWETGGSSTWRLSSSGCFTVIQQRQMRLHPTLEHELCPMSQSIIEEYSCFWY